jgi:Sap, sulfolipid-1-addressing protein
MTVDLILLGLAITLEPIPLSGYILVLSTKDGTRKAFGFIVGWILTLALVIVVTELVTGGKPPAKNTVPSTASLIAKIVIGLALLAVAWRQHARRFRPSSPPSWAKKLDQINFVAAAALAFLLQPWLMVAASVATVTRANLSGPATVVTLILFCVLATASYLVMQVYAVLSPERARIRLDGLRQSLDTHRDQLIIWLCVAVGLWLIGASIYQLTT